METILCATDFSKASINALEYAAELALEFNACLILMHCYESPASFSKVPFNVIEEAERSIISDSELRMTKLCKKLSSHYKGIRLTTKIAQGNVAELLLEESKKNNADLIVIGSTGASKLERIIMGSTASGIIQKSRIPVLCIPKKAPYKKINSITFATDLEEDNLSAAHQIVAFAKHFNAEIRFLFVDDKHLIHSNTSIDSMTRKIRKNINYNSCSGYIANHTNVIKGIEMFLKKYPSEILVMMTHDKRFPETLFNSSITRLMSFSTSIPLLALKKSTVIGS